MLHTMTPTTVSIATADAKAPTNPEVRHREPARLRDASRSSTPKQRPRRFEDNVDSRSTNAGMANTDAPMSRMAERYPKRGLPSTAGMRDAKPAARAIASAIQRSRALCTRAMYSLRARAIASTGETREASRAGDNAETTATAMPTSTPRIADGRFSAADPGVLLT